MKCNQVTIKCFECNTCLFYWLYALPLGIVNFDVFACKRCMGPDVPVPQPPKIGPNLTHTLLLFFI